jgi:hypothetical protein
MIGEFEAQDNRGIQTFHVEPEHAAYAKFIKVYLILLNVKVIVLIGNAEAIS